MNDALFDVPGARPAPPQDEKLSADRRRTRRQLDLLAAGRHPIGLVLNMPVRLHPDAAPADDRQAAGLRCRDCRFREVFGHHTRSYGKCVRGAVSHSAASDNRGWWPACIRFEPREGE